ncbi:MAG: response regulator [Nitrospiraceae bacterium]|nr:response regulator [Nitrospiraceae bacterium]
MGKTVLIVDDSATMRQVVSFALKDAGFEVISAVDGKDAIAKLGVAKSDLIITDLNMPNLNGIELIKQVRQTPGHKFTPIIMLTTESQESRKAEGRQAGVSGWIVKPFTPEQLLGVVKKFIR